MPDDVICGPVYLRVAAGLPKRDLLNRAVFVDEGAQSIPAQKQER